MIFHFFGSGYDQTRETSVFSPRSIIALRSIQTYALHVPRDLSAGIEED
jgi:hypothetical protein